MSVDELVAAARVDAIPANEVTERHRAQLRTRMFSAAATPPAGMTAHNEPSLLETDRRADPPRRLALVASAVLVAGGTIAGLVTLTGRHDAVQPIDSAAAVPQSSTASTLAPTSTTGATPTTETDQPQRVSPAALPGLVGPLNLELHPVTVDVAQVGGETLRLRMTDTELCIETYVGDLLYNTGCDVPPTTLTLTGEEHIGGPGQPEPTSFSIVVIGPGAVTLALLLEDGSPACALVGHPVPEVGPIIVWTCDQRGLVEPWDLHATADDIDVVAKVPIHPAFRDGPLPAIGDPIPIDDFGNWVKGWSSSGIPPRAVGLSPVGRDGVIIG